jgi:hypothetical protein
MNAIEIIENTNFHDSSIVELSMDGDHINLKFENVWLDDDNCYKVAINLGGVRKATCDHKVVNSLRMETDDGGVIAFRRSGNIADLVVTWTAYAPRTDETHSYAFDFDSFELQAEKQEQAAGE